MNIRKLSNLLEYVVFGWIAYCLIKFPENVVIYSIYSFGFLLVLETLLFGIEYFSFVRKGEITLINRRTTVPLDNTIRFLLIAGCFLVGAKNWDALDFNSTNGLLFSIVSTLKSAIFHKQKTSIRLDAERLLFTDLLERDIWLSEIESFEFDEENHSMTLRLLGGSKTIIKIKKEGDDEDELLRNEIITRMKSIPNVAYVTSRS